MERGKTNISKLYVDLNHLTPDVETLPLDSTPVDEKLSLDEIYKNLSEEAEGEIKQED